MLVLLNNQFVLKQHSSPLIKSNYIFYDVFSARGREKYAMSNLKIEDEKIKYDEKSIIK